MWLSVQLTIKTKPPDRIHLILRLIQFGNPFSQPFRFNAILRHIQLIFDGLRWRERWSIELQNKKMLNDFKIELLLCRWMGEKNLTFRRSFYFAWCFTYKFLLKNQWKKETIFRIEHNAFGFVRAWRLFFTCENKLLAMHTIWLNENMIVAGLFVH